MPESTLPAFHPLDGFSHVVGSTRIEAITDIDIVSIALPLDPAHSAQTALEASVKAHLEMKLPGVGMLERSDTHRILMGLQPGQWFLVDTTPTLYPMRDLLANIGSTAWLTDQSDSWVVLDIRGSDAQMALERICMLDLAAESLDRHRVARTIMEHLAVIIERPGQDWFRLYSPRSSARSFAHALTTSLDNVA